MKALTLIAPGEFAYGDVREPPCGPTDVIVAIEACGICGSDIHGMDGSSGRRIPPIIMGHEAAGTIAAVGTKVHAWSEGDRVAFDSVVFCGNCHSCREGHTNLCPDRQVIGVSCSEYCRHGAFAELISLPAHVLFKVPDGLTFEEAAFGEPVAVALHGVAQAGITEGQYVLVIGAGLIGLLVTQAAMAAGAAGVFVVDVNSQRIELAKQLGANDGYLANAGELASQLLAATDGHGIDVVMEVVGWGTTLARAVALVRNGGTIGCIGNLAAEVLLPLQQLVTREITLRGSCASSGEFGQALRMIADGKIKVKPLISAVGSFSQGQQWFDGLAESDGSLMKVILKPCGVDIAASKV